MIRRPAAGALIAVLWLIGLAGPASAHTVSGTGAANWKTTLTGIAPAVPGLSAEVVEGGSRVKLTNRGPEVVVLGYEGEPYLRIGPTGVFENTRSPAAYLNCSRTGCPVPAQADAGASPEWVKLSAGRTALWHDHRAHWMGRQLPPGVARAPNRIHVQAAWAIAVQQGSTPVTIAGRLTWIPGQSPLPWLVVAAILVIVGLTLGVTRRWRALAGAVGLLVAIDFYHAAAIAWSWSGNTVYRITQLVEGNSFSIAGWVVGLLAFWLLLRRRADGLYAAIFAGASVVLFTGALDFSVLSRSQAPFDGSITLDRLSVAVALGLGLGVALGALAGLRAVVPPPPRQEECVPADQPATLPCSA